MMRRLLALALLACCAAPFSHAQQSPQLLRDINTMAVPFGGYNMDPTGFVQMNGITYYTAYSANLQRQLWRTDGSSAGTRMLTNDPSLTWRIYTPNSTEIPASIVPMAGNLYFFTSNPGAYPLNQFNLVRADTFGNLSTLAVSNQSRSPDLALLLNTSTNLASGDAARRKMVAFGNALYFAFGDSRHGVELWKSDGTAAGTGMLKDLTGDAGSASPANFTVVGSTLFFTTMGSNGMSLWKSDGTAAGTVKLKDNIATNGDVRSFTAVNNMLYFIGVDVNTGNGYLWKSDGTAQGTVAAAQSGSVGQLGQTHLMKLGSSVIYRLEGDLMKYDGAVSSLLSGDVIADYAPGRANQWVELNGVLYFSGTSTSSFKTGLWKTDGTTGGTVAVKDGLSTFNYLNAAGTLYFAGNDNLGSGMELWKSDGSATGTVRISDFNANASAWSGTGIWDLGSDYPMVYQSGKVLLTAINDVVALTVPNSLLAASDGTPSGTGFVPHAAAENYGSRAAARAVWNGNLYFGAYQPATGFELWKTDGTPAGTSLLLDLTPGAASSYVQAFTPYKGSLYFLSSDSSSQQGRHILWRTDGTPAGTSRIRVFSDYGYNDICKMAVYDTTLFIMAGGFIYLSDGSNTGTTSVGMLAPGATRESIPMNFTMADSSHVVVVAGSGSNGYASELWNVSLARKSATRFSAGGIIQFNEMERFDNQVYFVQSNPITEYKLWKTDGTAAGTGIADPGVNPHQLTVLNSGSDLYYINTDGTGSRSYIMRLRAGGGSPAIIADWADTKTADFVYDNTFTYEYTPDLVFYYPVFQNSYHDQYRYFVKPTAAGPVYMPGGDAGTGVELYATDGTAAGTKLVRDIRADTFSSAPQYITPFPNKSGDTLIAFVANDGTHGSEIWISDGTAAGTRNYAQSIPGSNTLNPKYLTLLNGKLIFWGSSAAYGVEPYVYELQQVLKAGGTGAAGSGMELYPNPADRQLMVRGERGARIDVYNISGVRMLETTATGTTTILNIESLIPGVYQVRMTSGASQQTARFVKY